MKLIDFEGDSVMITAAGSGIGRASAELFASLGASVVVNDINAELAQATVNSSPRGCRF